MGLLRRDWALHILHGGIESLMGPQPRLAVLERGLGRGEQREGGREREKRAEKDQGACRIWGEASSWVALLQRDGCFARMVRGQVGYSRVAGAVKRVILRSCGHDARWMDRQIDRLDRLGVRLDGANGEQEEIAEGKEQQVGETDVCKAA